MLTILSIWLLTSPTSFIIFSHTNQQTKHQYSRSHLTVSMYFMFYLLIFVDDLDPFVTHIVCISDLFTINYPILTLLSVLPRLTNLTYLIFLYQVLHVPSLISASSVLEILLLLNKFLSVSPSSWLSFLKILLSNDVELNPGDFKNTFFSFCNWNINSLGKDNFQRVQLIEAHNSLYSYDLISLCETSLNDLVVIPDPLLHGYTFISKNKQVG